MSLMVLSQSNPVSGNDPGMISSGVEEAAATWAFRGSLAESVFVRAAPANESKASAASAYGVF